VDKAQSPTSGAYYPCRTELLTLRASHVQSSTR